jgi:glycosyltransferase involved in cell wall biosynthesis
MRILQIAKYYYPSESFGGPIQFTRNVTKHMIKKGHQVTVYASDAYDISNGAPLKDRQRNVDGAQVHYFHNRMQTHGFYICPQLIPALKKSLNRFDVVHLHEYRTFQNIVFHYLNKTKTPYVVSLHGELEYTDETFGTYMLRRVFNGAFGLKILNSATKIIALTPFEKLQLMRIKIPREKIVVVPNGINVSGLEGLPPKGSFKRAYGLADKEVVLFVGRLNAMKGVDVLIKAFSKLQRIGCFLVVAGPDDGMLSSLQALVSALKLDKRVLFTGNLSHQQVFSALNDAAVVVYATLQEGLPGVPMEAGLMGKAVVVSNHPSMRFVREGNFGLSVDYGDEKQLAQAITKLLSDRRLAEALGNNGKAYLKSFSWEHVSSQIEAVYLQAIKSKRQSD